MRYLIESDQKINQKPKGTPLKTYNQKDSKWNEKRLATIKIVGLLQKAGKHTKWADRMDECANWLVYALQVCRDSGEFELKLRNANLCHCRHCFICNWRRSLMYYARFFESLPKIAQEHPKARWVLLTLTVRNMPVESLRDALSEMNKGWQRLVKRKEFSSVLGWIRSTEVTQEKDRKGYAHPHFHVLMMVPPSYFTGKYYVKQARWLEVWRECMRDEGIMSVDVKSVKGDLKGGGVEVLKTLNYSIKPETAEHSPEWLLEYFNQVHKKRFLATGGVLKNALKKIDVETTEEMIFTQDNPKPTEEQTEQETRVFFDWDRNDMMYRERVKN
ncbi:Replication protein [Salmonella enterica subsp. enterica serovar Telhashomer]|nr:Replication protein [Salmonella enterica subsp. enterica serovar Telhashomer]